MASEEMDDREVFENVFFYFTKALRTLSSDATVQCEQMGDCHVPWHIQRDTTTDGLGSLRLSAKHLSWEQAEKIVDLVAALRRFANGSTVCTPSENDEPCWLRHCHESSGVGATSEGSPGVAGPAPIGDRAKQGLLRESGVNRGDLGASP
jgi:hypothetical protein